MKHKISSLLFLSVSATAMLTACGNGNAKPTSVSSSKEPTLAEKYGYDFCAKSTIPNAWVAETANKGTIEKVTYSTHSYALEAALNEENITLDKTYNVYLPYGYTAEKKYNVLFLLHGTEGEGDPVDMADYWLGPDSSKGPTTKRVFDHMWSAGEVKKDVIVVTPTYYSRVEGKNPTAEQYAALKAKLGETSGEWEKDGEQTMWTRFFGDELVNDIIPSVASKYSTFISGEATRENIVAARDHLAYEGLSRGSSTSVNSIMMNYMDCFAYIGSLSGIWGDFDAFKNKMETTWKDYPVKYWYNGNGTADFSHEDHIAFRDNVLSKMSDRFVDGENYAWVDIKGAAHAYGNWIVQARNSLLVFFNK